MSTERRNPRSVDIDLFPTERILRIINAEDALVPGAVAGAIPEISKVVELAVESLNSDGRIFYVGAGTSGRIAAVDAVECPPTFGIPSERVQAIVAGGQKALMHASETSEDDRGKAAASLKSKGLTKNDLVIGIAASGNTPYTLAALEFSKAKGAKTAALVCIENSPMSKIAGVTICVAVGPEIITGSTRMKAGTAHKLVLNMISTAAMIRSGKAFGHWMVDLKPVSLKLKARAVRIVCGLGGVSPARARALLARAGGDAKAAVLMARLGLGPSQARKRLEESGGFLRSAL